MSEQDHSTPAAEPPTLVIGLGVAGAAVVRALTSRGEEVIVVEDRPTDAHRELAAQLGVSLVEAPNGDTLTELVEASFVVVPSPGVPEAHPVFGLAAEADKQILSEFDLASVWDHRPIIAITGTDGKTTVTTLVTDMLNEGGLTAVAAGNTDVPLVTAIEDINAEVFVVEASSFRLSSCREFAPGVAVWLNFSPDHLDVHSSLESYEQAKARVWTGQSPSALAVGNADDAVVARHLDEAPGRRQRFSLTDTEADYHVDGDRLMGPRGALPVAVSELPRHHPHDLANALAAWAAVADLGVPDAAVAGVLRSFTGLAHRVEEVGQLAGITFVNDSKATVPHAALAAVAAFDSVVLIAGGRNKGLDLGEMAEAVNVTSLVGVVAIGDAADEVATVFKDLVPVRLAESMPEAILAAQGMADTGDVVLLSPGCASFDWYGSYGERGDHFRSIVERLMAGDASALSEPTDPPTPNSPSPGDPDPS